MTTIDIVSDPICPWCFIGKRRLDAAAQAAGVELNFRWRPFQLEPDLPPEGVDFLAQVRARYGAAHDPSDMFRRLEAAGGPFGIRFAMEDVRWLPQTLDAHRLLSWSAAQGGDAQHRLADALFSERFEHGGDIGDRATLARIAASVLGWDPAATIARLASDEDAAQLRAEAQANRALGIQTIPHVTIEGHKIDHTAPPEALARALATADPV